MQQPPSPQNTATLLVLLALLIGACAESAPTEIATSAQTDPPALPTTPALDASTQSDAAPEPASRASLTAPDPTTTPIHTVDTQRSDEPTVLADQPLMLRSIGPVLTGMTLVEAEAVLGSPIEFEPASDYCGYGRVAGEQDGPRLMVVSGVDGFADNTIVRIELNQGQQTASGIRIGSSKADVLEAYGDKIEITPHKYTHNEGGEYLTFVPTDEADSQYRLVMETLKNEVTQIRSGLLPAAEWVEGCF